MGAAAVRQAAQILDHTETIVAMELMAAAQGIDFRRREMGADTRLGRGTQAAFALIRERIPFLDQDVVLSPLIEQARRLVADGAIKVAVEAATSP